LLLFWAFFEGCCMLRTPFQGPTRHTVQASRKHTKRAQCGAPRSPAPQEGGCWAAAACCWHHERHEATAAVPWDPAGIRWLHMRRGSNWCVRDAHQAVTHISAHASGQPHAGAAQLYTDGEHSARNTSTHAHRHQARLYRQSSVLLLCKAR
jgi:hypothetical protein